MRTDYAPRKRRSSWLSELLAAAALAGFIVEVCVLAGACQAAYGADIPADIRSALTRADSTVVLEGTQAGCPLGYSLARVVTDRRAVNACWAPDEQMRPVLKIGRSAVRLHHFPPQKLRFL